ncbi:MAG: hypothetical protein J2P18_17380 [Nocardia sp.]|nr:hypothetical protein [Nocardia sp.]
MTASGKGLNLKVEVSTCVIKACSRVIHHLPHPSSDMEVFRGIVIADTDSARTPFTRNIRNYLFQDSTVKASKQVCVKGEAAEAISRNLIQDNTQRLSNQVRDLCIRFCAKDCIEASSQACVFHRLHQSGIHRRDDRDVQTAAD